ncbi:Protein kinase domain [Macleaya cordata]|uniref:Protein kinase domain n=1 Tax=Macleaya cordata TaxID=56857 RepID=A0A200Q0L1_MACCD|nr:Protein kinase domain [Macleaya cordata]
MGYLSCNAESAILTSNSHTITNKPKTKPKKSNKYKEEENPEKPIKFQEFQYRDLEAATNGFSDQKLLGRGSHGCVYKAVLRNGRLVAVKKPSRSSSFKLTPTSDCPPTNEVDNEIDILSKIQSPRLVNLVGFTTDSTDRLLVVEFMSNGTLYEILHSNLRPPNWARRIRLALQTAKAIDILHSSNPPVIHRDIKSANILIDRNFNARLGDFGLALRCHVDDFRLRSTPPAGTIGYLDPGYVTPDNLSTKTDVFSFGILLLEIISGRKAIDVGHSPPSIVDWAIPLVKKGKLLNIYDPRILPPKDPFVRKQLVLIASKCVRSCRERRPSMKDVVEGLSALSKLVPVHAWNGFSVGNPCMMVDDAVGRPVESKNNAQLISRSRRRVGGGGSVDDDALDDNLALGMRNSRRVYSDLGVGGTITRSNLMDLMAERDDTESDLQGETNGVVEPVFSKIRTSSLRVGSGRHIGRERRTESLAHDYDGDGVFQLRRNQSVGGILSSRSLRRDLLGCSISGAFRIQASNPV